MGDNPRKLRAIPIFANISKERAASLSKVLKEKRWRKGQYVFHAGDHADAMYILQSGEVEVRRVISRDPYKYKTLAILEKGDIFGEMSVFGEEFRSADVVVNKDALLWKLDYEELFNIIRNDPSSGVRILEVIVTILVSRIKSLNTELATLYELGRLLPHLNDKENLIKVVSELAINAVESAEVGLMAILNKFNEEFDVYPSSDRVKEYTIEYSDPISVWMFENKSPFIVKDTNSDRQFKDTFYSGRSFIASPVLHDNNLLGFIILANLSRKNAFNYNHMILLSAICAQVGERLYDIERKHEEALKERLSQTKMTILKTRSIL